jgi:proline racemase
MAVSVRVWVRARAAFSARGTYEVRVGGLGKLLLGVLTGGGIFAAVSTCCKASVDMVEISYQRTMSPPTPG